MMRQGFDVWKPISGGLWLLLLVFLVWPLSSVLVGSFIDNDSGAWSFSNYLDLWQSRAFHRAFINTFIAGFGGMAGALVLGLTLAVLTSYWSVKGRGLIQTLAILALVSPPFIGAYAWIVLFGANGSVRVFLREWGMTIPSIYGAGGVILVFAFKFYPYVYLIVSGALQALNPSLEEAAESLGVPPWQRFLKISLPMIMPAILGSALLTFVLSIADFGTPRLIGRDFNVLATEAFSLFASEIGGHAGGASALSVILIATSSVFVLLQRYAVRSDLYHSGLVKSRIPKPASGFGGLMVYGLAYLIVLCGAIPALTAVLFSFRKTSGPVFQPGWSLQSYEKILSSLTTPIINTLTYSGAAVCLIVMAGTLLGYLIARRRGPSTAALDTLLMVPYLVPGIVMGIALVTRFNVPPLAITGTGLIIVLAVFVRRLPYASRAVAMALRQLSPSLEDAAISLGYKPWQAFTRVTVPLIAPGIMAGALMSFVTAMNELSASLVLYVGGTITMPVRIYLSVMDGDYGTASALATVLLALTVISVAAAFHLSGRKQSVLL